MNIINIKTIAAVAILGACTFGNAYAMSGVSMPINSVIGVSSTDLRVHIEDGVAHIHGSVDSVVESALVETYVDKLDGVEEVTNSIYVN